MYWQFTHRELSYTVWGLAMSQVISCRPVIAEAPGSIPGQSMWALWWKTSTWGRFSSVTLMPLMLLTHSFIYNPHYIISAVDSAIKEHTNTILCIITVRDESLLLIVEYSARVLILTFRQFE